MRLYMTSSIFRPATAALLGALVASCQAPYEISRPDAERIINTLASDGMAGRDAFGPEIEQAQAFIAGEFEETGLEPWPGSDGFLQSFQVHGLKTSATTVRLSGREVPEDRYAIALGSSEASWTTGDGKPVLRIGPEDDASMVIRAMRGAEGEVLVLVDESHADMFARVRGFLSRPRYQMEPASGPSAAIVLTSDAGATDYEVRASGEPSAVELANVVGLIPGRRSDEIVVFSGHHDHIGIRPPADGDSIANGANDDASGTTAVLLLARFFADRPQPERTLLFATFTAEEAGGFGSRHFSNQLDPDQIVAMFNIEMIGKPAVSGPNTAWVTGWERSDFGPILERAVEGTEYRFYADPYPDQNLFYRSDNATLARLGVPAHSISTTPIDVDTDYHQVSDEVGTLDLDHMTNTIRAIAVAAETILSGQETPTRVDPERLK